MTATDKALAPSILDLINKTLELPTIPDVLVKLNDVMADPESSAEDVANVISLDPAVSTNILRIVNSAYYGLQVRVSSVSLAVSIMGFNMTKKVALKAAVFSVFGKKGARAVPAFSPNGFWEHSIYTGILARVLGQASEHFSGIHPEDLYICGLLHDIGKIILLESATDIFSDVLTRSVDSRQEITELEQEIFGYTHADVGSVLAIKWFLPEDLTIAIRYHHSPEKDPFHKTLSALICLADTVAMQRGKASVKTLATREITDDLCERVGISQDMIEELALKADDDYAASGTPW